MHDSMAGSGVGAAYRAHDSNSPNEVSFIASSEWVGLGKNRPITNCGWVSALASAVATDSQIIASKLAYLASDNYCAEMCRCVSNCIGFTHPLVTDTDAVVGQG
jgi:hypothetical protein